MHNFHKADYRVLFERSADAMLILDGNRFVDCNRAAVTLLGYEGREELMKARPSQLSPTLQPDGRRSDKKADEMAAAAFRNGSHRFEWLHKRACGEVFPVEVLLTVIPFGGREVLHVAWRDITQRKRTEERLRLSRHVIENTSEGVIVTDLTPAIIEVNPAYSRITGYDREESIGRNPGFSKSGHHDSAFYARMWQSLRRDGRWQGEIWDRRKDGELFPKQLRIDTIYDEEGQPLYYIGVFSDITFAKQAEKRLQDLAFSDPLTRLPNRSLFYTQLQREIISALRRATRIAILFIDLDHFKAINDGCGHSIGDQALIIAAERIRDAVRASDVVARVGGDEFTVILPDLPSPDAAAQVASKVVSVLGKPIQLDGRDFRLGASVGISVFPEDGDSVDDLMRHADIAMYQAKSHGRGGYCFFSEELNRTNRRRASLETEMRRSLDLDAAFVVQYQPMVDLSSGAWVGFEALARWRHPEFGTVPPEEFISLADDNGLIGPIGCRVLRTACRQVKRWNDRTGGRFRLAVNLSARQLLAPGLVEDLRAVLAETGVAADQLELDITESVMVTKAESAIQQARHLKDLGLRLAVDDFGAGFAALNHLRRFPVDTLKVDRSFVIQDHGSRRDSAILKAIVAMAGQLGLTVIYEGIETDEQLAFCRDCGAGLAQGFLFCHPLDAADIEPLLRPAT